MGWGRQHSTSSCGLDERQALAVTEAEGKSALATTDHNGIEHTTPGICPGRLGKHTNLKRMLEANEIMRTRRRNELYGSFSMFFLFI